MLVLRKKLREILDEKGMSIEKLAVRAGTSATTIHNAFERNDIKVSLLESIAGVLEVPVTYFFEVKSLKNYPNVEGNFNSIKGQMVGDIAQTYESENKCREELEDARKRIIELQEKVIELMGKK